MNRARVFISYSHQDRDWLEKVRTMLKPVSELSIWDDTEIGTGAVWRREIDQALASAGVAVLLVSPHFLASEFIAQHELPRFHQARRKGRTAIVWIPIRPALVEGTWLAEYQAACDPARPLSTLPVAEQEVELKRVCEEIVRIALAPTASRQVDEPAAASTTVAAADELARMRRHMRVVDSPRQLHDFPDEDSRTLFVYGSALNPLSLLRTVPRVSGCIEYVPAYLRGFRRSWGVPYLRLNMIDDEWRSIDRHWASLVVERGGRSHKVGGALVLLGESELGLMIEREAHYDLADVTSDIRLVSGEEHDDVVVAFLPRQADDVGAGVSVAVRRGYRDGIERGLRELGFGDQIRVPDAVAVVDAKDADVAAEDVWRRHAGEIPGFERTLQRQLRKQRVLRQAGNKLTTIPSCVRPMVLSRSVHDQVRRVAESALSLAAKALRVILGEADLQRGSGYREIDFAMARKDMQEGRLVPGIARVDLTLSRSQLRLFEINCDSPAGMFHLDVLTVLQQDFCERLGMDSLDYETQGKVCETFVEGLTGAWRAFCERTYRHQEPLRRVAIVERNWREWTTRSEFEHFEEMIKEAGCEAFICEPRELRYDGRRLRGPDGQPVDVVYKRVLWTDLLDPDDAELARAEQDLLNAYEQDAVCVVNSLGCRLLGSKYLLGVMQRQDFARRLAGCGLELGEEELRVVESHLPRTGVWEKGNATLVEEVLSHPERFVLKSFQGYGSIEVLMGNQIEQPTTTFRRSLDRGYIAQELVSHGRVHMPAWRRGNVEWQSEQFILGAYLVGGRCVAVEAKVAPETPISMNRKARRTAVFSTLA